MRLQLRLYVPDPPGKVKLRARSSDNRGKVRAIGNLTLVCNP